MTGGQERSEEEYGKLFDFAGFQMNRVIPTQSPVSIIEGQPKKRLSCFKGARGRVEGVGQKS